MRPFHWDNTTWLDLDAVCMIRPSLDRLGASDSAYVLIRGASSSLELRVSPPDMPPANTWPASLKELAEAQDEIRRARFAAEYSRLVEAWKETP